MPAFGQTAFGPNRIWPKIRIWPGRFRDRIWPNRIWPFGCFSVLAKISVVVVLLLLLLLLCLCVVVLWCVLWCPTPKDPNPKPVLVCVCAGPSVPTCCVFKNCCGGGLSRLLLVWPLLGPPSSGPPSARPPFPWTAQNFALCFHSLRRKFSFFLLLSGGVFSWNFGGVFEGRRVQMCTFGLSGCCVEPRRPHQTGPRGFTRQPENSKRAHLSVPALQTPQNSPRENPQREKKE